VFKGFVHQLYHCFQSQQTGRITNCFIAQICISKDESINPSIRFTTEHNLLFQIYCSAFRCNILSIIYILCHILSLLRVRGHSATIEPHHNIYWEKSSVWSGPNVWSLHSWQNIHMSKHSRWCIYPLVVGWTTVGKAHMQRQIKHLSLLKC